MMNIATYVVAIALTLLTFFAGVDAGLRTAASDCSDFHQFKHAGTHYECWPQEPRKKEKDHAPH